jgi:hypothetical protein
MSDRLDAFLAPDVVCRVLGSPGWDCVIEGRDAVYAAIRTFLDGFDRRCERSIAAGSSAAVIEGDTLRVLGVASHRRDDRDPLRLEIELLSEYRDGLIVGLSDVYPLANRDRTRAWMTRWGADLEPSYV